MSIQGAFRSLTQRLQSAASVETVYGEPIVVEGKTIIPVARVRYGFGADMTRARNGASEATEDESPDNSLGTGGGGKGGGGVEVTPIGVIEVTPGDTRYISFEGRRRAVRSLLLGGLVGLFLLRRRRRG